jgi:hypothetical protein
MVMKKSMDLRIVSVYLISILAAAFGSDKVSLTSCLGSIIFGTDTVRARQTTSVSGHSSNSGILGVLSHELLHVKGLVAMFALLIFFVSGSRTEALIGILIFITLTVMSAVFLELVVRNEKLALPARIALATLTTWFLIGIAEGFMPLGGLPAMPELTERPVLLLPLGLLTLTWLFQVLKYNPHRRPREAKLEWWEY